MKNKTIKVMLLIILFLMMLSAFSYSASAASLNLTSDKNTIGIGEEVLVKVNTDENIETTTFYLNYDSRKIEFIESQTDNVAVKDYEVDGTLRVAYADLSKEGTNELNFKFKAKEDNVNKTADIQISKFTLHFINDSKTYNMNNLANSSFKTSIKIVETTKIKPLTIILIAIALITLITLIVLLKTHRRQTFIWRRSM